jgi:antitoxin (DNA-binding transcriptional repressor) of toxin-antitoxin stability system
MSEDLGMFAKQINLEEATVQELLALIQEGSEVILTKGTTPVARVTPIDTTENALPTEKKERIPGLHAGMIWTSNDFDDPLPDEFWFGDE